jgi:hypothetical protein
MRIHTLSFLITIALPRLQIVRHPAVKSQGGLLETCDPAFFSRAETSRGSKEFGFSISEGLCYRANMKPRPAAALALLLLAIWMAGCDSTSRHHQMPCRIELNAVGCAGSNSR